MRGVYAATAVFGAIAWLLYAYAFVIFVRALLSWFPHQPDGMVTHLDRALGRITDPVLDPVRRTMPRTGMVDFSPMLVMFGCIVLAQIVGHL